MSPETNLNPQEGRQAVMDRSLEAMRAHRAGAEFREADDRAWDVLREALIPDLGYLKGHPPKDLAANTPEPLRTRVSEALTQIALSYSRHAQERHFHVVLLAEHAVQHDPGNLIAAALLGRFCSEVRGAKFIPYYKRGEREWPIDHPEEEIARERLLGKETLIRALRANHITEAHLNREKKFPTLKRSEDRGLITSCLVELGKLCVHEAAAAESRSSDRAGALMIAEGAYIGALQSQGFFAPLDQLIPKLRSKAAQRDLNLVANAERLGLSCSGLGSVHELSFRFPEAMNWYALALEVDLTNGFAANRLAELQPRNPLHDPVRYLTKTYGAPDKGTSEVKAPDARWLALQQSFAPEELAATVLEKVEDAASQLDHLKTSWSALLDFARDWKLLGPADTDVVEGYLFVQQRRIDEFWELGANAEGFVKICGVLWTIQKVREGRWAGIETACSGLEEALQSILDCYQLGELCLSDRDMEAIREILNSTARSVEDYG